MTNKINGNTNILSKEQEQQRLQIVDLELKARYWEAQWKIRFYTLESEKLQKDYDDYVTKQQKIQQEAMERFQAQIEEMNRKAQEEVANKMETAVVNDNKEFLDSLQPLEVNPLTSV